MSQVELPTELHRVCDEIDECSRRHAEAVASQLRAQAAAEELRARLAVEVRRRMERGDKRATERAVEAMVASDEGWLDARRRAIEAEIERVRLQSRLDALMARKDILLWTVAS
jgi:hypothetical protein